MTSPLPAVLSALAELAPTGADRNLDVTRGGQPLVWLDDPDRAPRGRDLDRLAALDTLHREERILRRGWAFVAGTTTVDGAARRVRLPLLSQPVRLDRGLGGYRVVPAGDLELTPLVTDRALAARLEAAPGLGSPGWLPATGTAAWLRTAAAATGLPLDAVAEEVPTRLPDDRLVLLVTAGLFVVRDVFGPAVADTLRSWAARPGLDHSVLAVLYEGVTDRPTAADRTTGRPAATDPAATDPAAADPAADVVRADSARAELAAADFAHAAEDRPEPEEPLSPLPLTAAQQQVVRSAGAAPVTVVSGAPGTGKSHAVVAAALDVVHRGGSVLVATQSAHAADVLAALLARYPAPTPVLFGDAERRTALADELAPGLAHGGDHLAPAARAALEQTRGRVRELSAALRAALEVERRAAELPYWQPLLAGLEVEAPGLSGTDADLGAAGRLAARATAPAGGWWSRLRRALARRRLRRLAGAAPDVPLDRLVTALRAARARQAAGSLAASGGTDLAATWAALWRAEMDRANAVGRVMRAHAGGGARRDGAHRRAAAALAGALRAGRNRRRELLAALDGPALVQALPLWIGTVADVADLLPPEPALFDLVVLDEASHIDQARAAPVLARARRALVVGDPHQLRFVSFVSDVDVATTLRRHGLDSRVDVRRISAFDLAAGAAPVIWLDEHHRSTPQLIEFSARRFYAGRLAVTTTHPRTEGKAAIEVIRVPDAVVADGVNRAEVAAVLGVLRRVAAGGSGGIGVITPFRAQADALEAALLADLPAAEIDRLGLRVGTVHAFQGSEADVVVASLGVVDADPPGRLRFLADPRLFNVLVTRARQRMIVVTSVHRPAGLLADYLRYAESLPAEPAAGPVAGAAAADWAGALAVELRRAGLTVRPDYAVGRWRVDLCVGDGARAVALICAVHPGGPRVHLARQRALQVAGWRLVDAFASRWGGDAGRAAVELATGLFGGGPV